MNSPGRQLIQVSGTAVDGEWFVFVISDCGRYYEDSNEGPFESYAAAYHFAKAEVGVRWQIVRKSQQPRAAIQPVASEAGSVVRRAARRARIKYGTGWQYLSADQRRGAVCVEFVELTSTLEPQCVAAAAQVLRNAQF